MPGLPRILKKPVLLLDITGHGGTVYRIASRTDRFNMQEYMGLILEVSGSGPSIDPDTFEYYNGGYSLTLINNKPVFGVNRFSDLAASESFSGESATLYWDYEGVGTMALIYQGIVNNLSDINYETCTLSLVDFATCYEKKSPWPIALETDYPGIDPDDVGKIINTIYGTVDRAPCLAIDAGGKTTLASDLLETQTSGTFEVSDGSKFPSAGAFTVQIESEQILVTRSSNTFTISTRGYNGTEEQITDHDKGQAIAEIQTEYIYLLANHPVTSIDEVYVDGIRQVEDFRVFTGQGGDEHVNYPGRAIIVFDVLPSFAKQTNLAAEDSIEFTDGSDYSGTYDGMNPQRMFWMTLHKHSFTEDDSQVSLHSVSGTCTSNCDNCMVNNDSYSVGQGSEPMWTFTQAVEVDKLPSGIVAALNAPAGTPYWYRTVIDYEVQIPWTPTCMVRFHINGTDPMSGYHWYFNIDCSVEGEYTVTGPDSTLGWAGFGTWEWYHILNSGVTFKGQDLGDPDGYILIRKVEFQILYVELESQSKPALGTTPDGIIYRVGTVSVTGNSSADVVIGKIVAADTTGYNVRRPDLIRSHMLTNLYGASYDITTFNAAGSIFAAKGYQLGILINDDLSFKDLQDLFLKQCRTALYWKGNAEYMKFLA